MALTLTLNGTSRDFHDLAPGANLLDLLAALELKGDRVALEINGEIAPRSSWLAHTLAQNDKIELVHFVGGGADTSLFS